MPAAVGTIIASTNVHSPHSRALLKAWTAHDTARTADQVEDKEGETPLSMAAKHGKLRDLMVQVATGQMDVDEVL